jgi:hypothetical protein
MEPGVVGAQAGTGHDPRLLGVQVEKLSTGAKSKKNTIAVLHNIYYIKWGWSRGGRSVGVISWVPHEASACCMGTPARV